jgi:hypothetical protein
MDTNEMIALLLPPNGCFACSDTRKEIAEELARRSVDLERECADADKICAALGLTVDKSRTEGGSLNVPRIVGHIQETLTALRESHAFGVAMSDKYVASRAPECAAAQKPVAWATPSLLVTLSAVEKNHLTNPDRRKRGGEVESIAQDAERYSVPLYTAPPAQAEPQEGDLLHTMMEWARTEEGRKQLADSYRPHLWACAKRVADPQNEAATCRHWCGDIEHCQPIASAPAQPEPRTIPAHVQPATLSPPTDWDDAQPEPAEDDTPVAWMVECTSANKVTGGRHYADTREKCEQYATFVFGYDCTYTVTPLVPAARLAALREERDRAQADAYNAVWNLGGCDSVANGWGKPWDKLDMSQARPALLSVIKLANERDGLRAALAEAQRDLAHWKDCHGVTADALAEAQRDAERWRWLRNRPTKYGAPFPHVDVVYEDARSVSDDYRGTALDSLIDAARKG